MISVIKTGVRFGVALIACCVFLGCGKHDSGKSGAQNFAGAPPEIQAAWDQAVAADKANDYATAAIGYKRILQQQDKLQPEQISLVQDASGKLFQRMVDASSKGDAQARQAIATLGTLDRQQSRP